MEIILTPNRRLAATLMKEHQLMQLKQHKQCWPTPSIMPLSSWLESIFFKYSHHETSPNLLLTQAQEQTLWEEIMKELPQSESLLQVSEAAKLAMSAWELLKQWRIDVNSPEVGLTDDGLLLQQCAKRFKKKCDQNKWLDHASLPDYLTSLINTKKIHLPSKIHLIGFLEITPQINELLKDCKTNGVDIILDAENSDIHAPQFFQLKHAHRISLLDQQSEINTMARWAKVQYTKNQSNPLKIACIIPNLESCRDQIKKTYDDVLGDIPFNISAGKMLSSYPIIYTGLQLLNLYFEELSIDILSHLLRSPFLGEAEKESHQRALYDEYLHHINATHFSINSLISQEDVYHLSSHCPLLANRFRQYKNKINNQKFLLPSQWADFFNEILSSMGWPGERSLNSEEYQLMQNAWLPLLTEFARLDLVLPPITLKKAYHYLNKLAENTVFQPQSPEASIQVLGMLEAAGLHFDSIWVMGLDDTNCPPIPSPNPFIPLPLQKKLNMPNASAEREYTYSKKIIDQFIESSNEITVSYSAKKDDLILRHSPLIKHLEEITVSDLMLDDFTPLSNRIYNQRELEHLPHENAPSLSNEEIIYGGASIFKFQAECPFKAFSALRLNAKQMEASSIGLRASDRGKIIHQVLEYIWTELKDSDSLHALGKDELLELISNCIEKTFIKLRLIQIHLNKPRYLSIEKNRLRKLLLEWLEVEKSRPSFKVSACEQEREITIGKITTKVRIDRIDQVASGVTLIIDYKTGNHNKINSWFGNRLDEPQLPLYCTTNLEKIKGIAFGIIHAKNIEFKGISQSNLDIENIKPINEIKYSDAMLWDDQIAQWHESLTKLANDFYLGNAAIDPKHSTETCSRCHLHSLCRIYENE